MPPPQGILEIAIISSGFRQRDTVGARFPAPPRHPSNTPPPDAAADRLPHAGRRRARRFARQADRRVPDFVDLGQCRGGDGRIDGEFVDRPRPDLSRFRRDLGGGVQRGICPAAVDGGRAARRPLSPPGVGPFALGGVAAGAHRPVGGVAVLSGHGGRDRPAGDPGAAGAARVQAVALFDGDECDGRGRPPGGARHQRRLGGDGRGFGAGQQPDVFVRASCAAACVQRHSLVDVVGGGDPDHAGLRRHGAGHPGRANSGGG